MRRHVCTIPNTYFCHFITLSDNYNKLIGAPLNLFQSWTSYLLVPTSTLLVIPTWGKRIFFWVIFRVLNYIVQIICIDIWNHESLFCIVSFLEKINPNWDKTVQKLLNILNSPIWMYQYTCSGVIQRFSNFGPRPIYRSQTILWWVTTCLRIKLQSIKSLE